MFSHKITKFNGEINEWYKVTKHENLQLEEMLEGICGCNGFELEVNNGIVTIVDGWEVEQTKQINSCGIKNGVKYNKTISEYDYGTFYTEETLPDSIIITKFCISNDRSCLYARCADESLIKIDCEYDIEIDDIDSDDYL